MRLQLLTAVLLVTVTFAQADEGQRCVTVEAGSNAVEAFIAEHYEGWVFLWVSPRRDGASYEVYVYPDVDYMMVCMGSVQVTDDCQVISESGTPLVNSAAVAGHCVATGSEEVALC